MRIEKHAFRQVKVGFFDVALPERDEGKALPLVVALHGQGGTPTAVLSAIAPALPARKVIVIAPTAPHEHEEQMLAGERGWRAWPMAWQRWPDDGFPRDDVLALDVPRIVTTSIADCIAETRRRFAVDDRPAILLGHSEGATCAVTYARHRPAEVRACYAYAGGPYDDLMRNDAVAHALGSVDLRIAHHRQDDGNRFEGSEALSAYLTERDVAHTTYFTAGTHHGVTEDVIEDMRAYVELFI